MDKHGDDEHWQPLSNDWSLLRTSTGCWLIVDSFNYGPDDIGEQEMRSVSKARIVNDRIEVVE